jgi:uncharacterized protein YgiM (DUF1202 family)
MAEGPSRAATVEPKVQLLVRERPSTSARIVDRVPPGRKLPLVGRTADGVWAHVQAPRSDGWVPSEQLRGMVKARKQAVESDEDDQVADEEEEVRKPLAKRRNVRPEAWVSASRYHDGESNKLTVSSEKAEIYGRPQAGGSVLGILRRGEVVSLVRKSSDKKWCLVDIGGGDVAWITAKAVKPGAAKGGSMPSAEIAEEETPRKMRKAPVREVQEEVPVEEPPPPPVRKKRMVQPEEQPQEVASNDVPVEEPPPPPPPKKTKKQLREEARLAREEAAARDAARDDEQAPLPSMSRASTGDDEEKPVKRRRVRLASRDMSGVGAEASVSRSNGPPHGANYFGIGVRGGLAILQTRFTSNGTGALSNYESSTNAFAIQVGLGYTRAIGKYFRLGLDGSYAFAGAAGVRYHTADNSDPVLGVQMHNIDAGANVGLHFNAIGGIDIRARIGMDMTMNLIQASTKVPLPSDRVLGMAVGLGLDFPSLFRIMNRSFGLHLYGGGIVPASRAQTAGLLEGANSTTYGAAFGGFLSFQLYKGLDLDAAYSYSFAATHFDGQAPTNQARNLTITSADRGSAAHLLTVGLSYNL